MQPGGAAAHLSLAVFERHAACELGVVCINFGLGNEWKNVWNLVRWVRAGVEDPLSDDYSEERTN